MSNAKTPEGVTQQLVVTPDDPRFLIQMGADGLARRVCSKVELAYGPDLYYPRGGTPSNQDRVAIWGTGPSKIVAAMGGRLEALAYSYDAEGNRRQGLRILEDEAGNITGTECDAVCLVRSPMTGEWIASHATAYESVTDYRDKELSKLARGNGDKDAPVRFIVEGQIEKARAAGRMVTPYGPGLWIAANLDAASVRSAVVKARDFADRKILAGRIRTKAMRLAFLGNAVCAPFAAFEWGALAHPENRPPFAPIRVWSWVTYESRQALTKQMDALLKEAGIEDSPIPLLEHDTLSEAIDAEFEEVQEQKRPEPMARQVKKTPEPAQAAPKPKPKPAPKPAAKQEPTPKAEQKPTPAPTVPSGEWDALLTELDEWEGEANANAIEALRADADLDPDMAIGDFPEHYTLDAVRKYMAALAADVQAQ